MTEHETGQLADLIISKGFDQPNFKKALIRTMVGNMEDGLSLYPAINYFRHKEDMVYFGHDFSRTGDQFRWTGVEVQLLRILPIRHGVFGSVDTADLEKRMRPIPWHVDFLDPFDILKNIDTPGVKNALPKMRWIRKDIEYLMDCGDKKALDIALALIDKYWMAGNYGKGTEVRKERIKNLDIRKYTFDPVNMDITLNRAYNMLWERHVRMREVKRGNVSFHWQLLEIPPGRQERPYAMVKIPDFDLGKIMQDYRFTELQGEGKFSAIKNFNDGNLVQVASPLSAEVIYLCVDAIGRTLKGFNRFMEQVDIAPFRVKQDKTVGKNPKLLVDSSKKRKGRNH